MYLSDRVTGIFLIVLGALAFWGGSRLPGVPGQNVGPAVFPMLTGVGLMICGLLIAFSIGQTFAVEEPEESPQAPGLARHLGRMEWVAAFLPPALLIFYVMVAERLGFLLTAAAMVLVCCRALGASWRLTILTALLAPPFVHLVFYKLLKVPLPAGLLAAPW